MSLSSTDAVEVCRSSSWKSSILMMKMKGDIATMAVIQIGMPMLSNNGRLLQLPLASLGCGIVSIVLG